MTKEEILKMNVTKQVEYIMLGLERQGHDISEMDSQKIVLTMYHNLYGVDNNTKLYEYFSLFTARKIPAYESVTRAIRKARENNPAWEKPRKKKKEQVEDVKKQVGY